MIGHSAGEISVPQFSDIAVIYLSLAVPDNSQFTNNAVHRNGNLYMQELLCGLAEAFPDFRALSAQPVQSWAMRSARSSWWIPGQRVTIRGTPVTLVPFLNITPLKQLIVGAGMLSRLLVWGLGRHSKKRVIVLFNLSVPPPLFVWVAAKLTRSKFVAYVCDVNVPGHTVPDTLLFRLDYWLQRQLLPSIDGLAVITDRIAIDFAPKVRYVRIDGGVPPEITLAPRPPTNQLELQIEPVFRVVVSGKLSAFNGIAEILSAFELLKCPHLRLCIAGRGPLAGLVQEAAARDARVNYLGFLPYDELVRLHTAADLLLSIRVSESIVTRYAFPSKTMEYLASGVPVVATRTGHLEAEYGDLCYILNGESPKAIADAIESIQSLTRVERSEMGDRARNYMLSKKTWTCQSKVFAEFVAQTAHGSRPITTASTNSQHV